MATDIQDAAIADVKSKPTSVASLGRIGVISGLVFSVVGNVFQAVEARNKFEELKQKQIEISQRTSELDLKARELTQKGRELDQKDRELSQRELEVSAQKQAVEKACDSLQRQMVEINDDLMRTIARKRKAESDFRYSSDGTPSSRLQELARITELLDAEGKKLLEKKRALTESANLAKCPIEVDKRTPGWPPPGT